MKFPFLVLAVSLLFFLSCRKSPSALAVQKKASPVSSFIHDSVAVNDSDTVSDLALSFRAVVRGGDINSDTTWHANGLGDHFTVTRFSYYVSNVTLKKEDGSVFAEPESYHLIEHMHGDKSFTITGIPEGSYTSITFLIGVDSIRNVSGAQSGALDPAHNMFWDWNTGYIFYKLEGNYVAFSTTAAQYAFHVGGFEGPDKCLQWVTLQFGGVKTVSSAHVLSLELTADAAEVFYTPHQMGFDDYNQSSPGQRLWRQLSENYSDMFKIAAWKEIPR